MKVAMMSSVSIAANTTVANIISGQRYERPPFDAYGTLYACGSAAGIQAEINVGGRSVTPPCTVNAMNRMPVVPDDLTIDGWEAVKDQLVQLTAINTTGGALTFFWRIELEYAPGGQG
jgi:hypothetical protein